MTETCETTITTTEEHFETFKRACQKWIDIFGLTEWTIYYEHKPAPGMFAQTVLNVQNAIATLRLAKEWPDDQVCPVTNEAVEENALHEVIHVLLGDLDRAGCSRSFDRSEMSSILERTVHRIEHALDAVQGKVEWPGIRRMRLRSQETTDAPEV